MPPETEDVIDSEEVVEAQEEETPEEFAQAVEDEKSSLPDDPEEVEITIGGEEPEPDVVEKAPGWVSDLRKKNRELARELREVRASQAQPAATSQVEPIGPQPAMADSDVDYDAEKFAAKLLAWNERKRAAEDAKRSKDAQEQSHKDAWQKTMAQYETEKKALKVSGYEDAEATVQDALSVVQQGIIIQGADNRAQIVYALGRNPKRLHELAAITDPVKFAIEIGKVSALMKVTTRKPVVAPETGVRGGSPGVTSTATKTDAMLKRAQTSGDYTEYFKAQRAARAAKKS